MISYNSKFEKIKKLEAHTLLSNGKKLKASSIQDLSHYYDNPIYSSNRVKVISMPEVVKGNTIEWEINSTGKPYIKGEFCDCDQRQL